MVAIGADGGGLSSGRGGNRAPMNPRHTEPTDDADPDERHDDPRLRPPGRSGMPGEVLDTDHNMPGQQGPPPAPDDAE